MYLKGKGLGKRILSLLVIVGLIFSLAGCAVTGDEKTGQPDQPDPSKTADTARPKLTIALSAAPNVENYDTNHLTKVIEEDNNVDLEFVLLPADNNDATTKFSLMVSGGAKLPDILTTGGLGQIVAFDFASKGVFRKLNDYYANPELAVNYHTISEEDREFVYKMLKLPDGNVYSLFRFAPFEYNEASNRCWVNGVWLEKVNMEIPTTTDELYETLKVFVSSDPNENGKADEIGIVGAKSGYGVRTFDYLINSFLYADAKRNFFNLENGKLVAAFIEPEWREGLEYMHKLCKEGLFSPLTFTQDYTQLKALINVKKGIAGFVSAGGFPAFGPDILDDMVMIAPLKGPKGVAHTAYTPCLPTDCWYITKDCQDPELAFSVGDYLLSDRSYRNTRFGERGVDWTDDPEITKDWYGNFEGLLGIPAGIVQLIDLSGVPHNKMWDSNSPRYQSRDTTKQEAFGKREDLEKLGQPYFAQAFILYEPYFPDPSMIIDGFLYTKEEMDQIANIKTVIDAYVYDMAVAFITGNEPLSKWDSYLKELEKMGLEEYLAASQKAYERVTE